MKKLKRVSFTKKIPVVFQFPKSISKEEWITIVNMKKSLETFGEDIKKNSQLLNQKNVKFIRIKPNAKFLPLSLKQKLFLAGLIPASVLSLITGHFLLLLPVVIASIIPLVQNALVYSDFSWSKAMDIKVQLNNNKDYLLEHIEDDSFRGGILGVDGLSPAWDDKL